ncbi:unnamed protein product, partial [Rotaria magnacalcarata]
PHCTVTVHTDVDDVMLNINGDHCHPREPKEIQIRKFKQAVKIHAIHEITPIPQIYDEEAARIYVSTLSIAFYHLREKLVSEKLDFLLSKDLF